MDIIDFIFTKLFWWVAWGIIGLMVLSIILDYLHHKITYRLYNNEEYFKYRKKMENVDWNLNAKNAKRVEEVVKEILLKHNMVLDEHTGYVFEFVENTFHRMCYDVYVSEHYGEGRILVKNVMVPESLIPRINKYKKWF